MNTVSISGQTLKDCEWLLENDPLCLSEGGMCVKSEYCEECNRCDRTGLCQQEDPNGVCCHKGMRYKLFLMHTRAD